MNHKQCVFDCGLLCDGHQFEVCIDLWPHFFTYKSNQLTENKSASKLDLHSFSHEECAWNIQSNRFSITFFFFDRIRRKKEKKIMFPVPSGPLICCTSYWNQCQNHPTMPTWMRSPSLKLDCALISFIISALSFSIREFMSIIQQFPDFI